MEGVESVVREDYKRRRFDEVRRTLQMVGLGQAIQLAIWVGLLGVIAPFWIENRSVPHLLIAGLLLHAYGILVICGAVVQLLAAGRLYYTGSIVECQKRLSELEQVRIR